MNPFETFGKALISSSGLRRLGQGHLWIYAADVKQEPEADVPLVKVFADKDAFVGYALFSKRSQIRLRFLSREAGLSLPDLLRRRVIASIKRRKDLLVQDGACRLVFGEADLLPSLIVDRYGPYVVLQTLSYGMDALKSFLVEILKHELAPDGIVERNDVKARRLEGLQETKGPLWGTAPPEVEIKENGKRFLVDLMGGQKTGFFLDQRENRAAAARYASGRALDCFTNTGGFAINFAVGCTSVVAVDISQDAIAKARRNAELNQIGNIDFQLANAFDYLREMEQAGETFDIISLDPPAFAKNSAAFKAARSGYKEINLRAIKLLRSDGVLVTSSCSYHMSETAFLDLLHEAAHDAHRYLQLIERRGQASDHPVLTGMPETHYLKCFILRVLA